jgi:hypothetical protein
LRLEFTGMNKWICSNSKKLLTFGTQIELDEAPPRSPNLIWYQQFCNVAFLILGINGSFI